MITDKAIIKLDAHANIIMFKSPQSISLTRTVNAHIIYTWAGYYLIPYRKNY